MKFIIIILILIIFNIIIFIFSDKNISNNIVNYFQNEDDLKCAFEHIKPDRNSDSYDHKQCRNRCNIFYRENIKYLSYCRDKKKIEELVQICSSEDHCPEKKNITNTLNETLVTYIPQGKGNKVKIFNRNI